LCAVTPTGLFTPDEYAARQREVQQKADADAAAAEEQKEAVRRELSLELQVAFSSCSEFVCTDTLQLMKRKKALREAALKKMSFDIDDET
jgi:hypothetical protein